MTRRGFLERGRDAAYGAGMLGAISGGATGGIFGFFNVVETADVVTTPAYWNREPIAGAYEPAIEHAAEHDAVTGRIVHMDYDTMDGHLEAPDTLDRDAYMDAVDTYLAQVGLDSDLAFERVDPADAGFVPDEAGALYRFERNGYEKGLFAVMDAVDDNMRESEAELIGVVGPFNQAFVGGQAPPQLDGVFHVDVKEDMTNDEYGRITAHEILHELGVGHTLFDGMSNVPLTDLVNDDRGPYFGGETRAWWDGIADRYED